MRRRLGPLAEEHRVAAALTRKELLGGLGAAGAATLLRAEPDAAAAVRPRTREYWIAAVPVTWNIVPNGRDAIGGKSYPASSTVMRTVVFRAFTPGWRRALREHDGDAVDQFIPGPLIRARVGDTILVHFKNLDTEFRRPHSMHFHGVHYSFASDGSYLPGFSGPGANVEPGGTHTYRLQARADSVGVWPYHDHSPSMHESIMGGLYGSLSIVGSRARLPDREFVVFFGAMNEFMTINGRAFVGNTPVFRARLGQTVQWNVFALGDEFHTFHVHGHRWRGADGTFLDTRTIGPAESFAVRWREDVPGAWLYHCHVEQHMTAGMIGLYRVTR